MDILEWAKKEVEIAIEREKVSAEKEGDHEFLDYTIACYERALKALKYLYGDEHSGMSIMLQRSRTGFLITKRFLSRLIDGKPLTPIEDTPDVWSLTARPEDLGYECYQCTRMSSLFKDVLPDGTVRFHDVNRVVANVINSENPDIPWHSGVASRLVDKMYPITFPYIPENKPYLVKMSEILFDPEKGGDFDTIAVWSLRFPDGSEDIIHKFYKEDGNEESGWKEIDEEEFREREAVCNSRLSKH